MAEFSLGFWVLGVGCGWVQKCLLAHLRALKIPTLHKNCVFQCMGKIFCLEFQRQPLKFRAKYFTHTLQNVYFNAGENFKALRFKSW